MKSSTGTAPVTMAILLLAFLALTVNSGLAGQRELTKRDAVISDSETGLVWPVNVDSPSFKSCPGGLKTYQQALEYVQCLNANEYLGYSDWRLPSPEELVMLYHAPDKGTDMKIAGPKLRAHGFKIDNPVAYWTSSALTEEIALAVDVLGAGEVFPYPLGRLSSIGVWPVRGGK